jgi:putative sigma-54 modulation protein
MEIIISGRHLDVSTDLKAYAEEKLAALGTDYSKLTTARMVLEMERSWHLAEAHINGKGVDMEATARTRDMYTSIDEAVAKLEKQLRRYLDKVQAHRRGQVKETEAEELAEEDIIA